jgi:peptidyl-prolyl cis-trans isomerase B (cyclophilin B)
LRPITLTEEVLMSEHKSPTQVTIFTGEGTGEFHGLVRRYWKWAALFGGVVTALILFKVIWEQRKVKAVETAWNRVRKDVQFQPFSIRPAPLAVLGGLEEELVGTSAAPWVKAVSVGSQLEDGKPAQALEAAKSLAAAWPDHLLSRSTLFHDESAETSLALPGWIETVNAATKSFEDARLDLSMNPPPSAEAPRVRLKTSEGDVVVALYDQIAPKHAENFLKLCGEGYYDGTKIHRIVPGEYLEAGDPNTKSDDVSTWGSGGPDYSLPHEGHGVWNYKYALTSVQAEDDYTSKGSMFRILLSDVHSFDGSASVFGVVVEGNDVLEKLGAAEVTDGRPVESISIDSTEMVKAG